jgi:dihydroneopterin aldolase/2-amino-4-hydroxy-6-hydroxymethyldihydropteridine diphosphokinase
MFEIIIKNLKLFGYHGVNPAEKTDGQEFVFDIKVELDRESFRSCPGGSYIDNIAGTVNYSDIIKLVKRVNSSNRFDLLETLTEEIAGNIFAIFPGVSALEIHAKKSSPPITETLDHVGVKFKAERDKFLKLPYYSEFLNGKSTGNKIFYLSIGSNIGDREKNIRIAVEKLAGKKNIEITCVSSIYDTEPLYYKKQDSFYNVVCKGCWKVFSKKIYIEGAGTEDEVLKQYYEKAAAFELLGYLKFIEFEMKRVPDQERYGPRIIDLDIVDFSGVKINSDFLTLPHPKFKERNFVMLPLAEIEPGYIIDNLNILQFLNVNKPEGKAVKISGW